MRLSKRDSGATRTRNIGRSRRAAAIGAAALFATAGLAGCGTKTISGDDVASQVSSQLEAKVGQKPDKVTCPDLKGKKGTTIHCTLTASGKSYDVKVTTTSVDGNKVRFSIKVADSPKS